MNVLLADDELFALEMLEEAVAEALPDANRVSFSKAAPALAYARENPVDMAFLDIHMRLTSGPEMARQLMETNPQVTVYFCTGDLSGPQTDWPPCVRGGICKPIYPEDVTELLQSFVL